MPHKTTILCPSPLINDSSIKALVHDYLKRMDHDVDFRIVKAKTGKNDPAALVKDKQGEALLAEITKMPSSTCVFALDERGKQFDSLEFAKMIQTKNNDGFSNFCFIIGGAHGLSQDILNHCQTKISFGKMVWPHRFVGLMLIEQLYRAQQINKGHPYHKA